MKRNQSYKKAGYVLMAIGLFAASFFSSCKDNSPGSVDFSKSPALLGWQYTGFQATPMITAIYGKSNDSVNVEVTLSVATLTIGKPVTFDIVPDDAAVAAYNASEQAAGNSDYQNVQLSPSLYTLPNGGHMTIKPGQQTITFTIRFAGQNVNFNQQNALGLKITNVSGALLASNLSEIVFPIVLKSIYAGVYEASGTRHHPTLGNFSFDYNVTMSTVDKITIDGPALADLQVDLQLHINPDNTVVVTSPGAGGQPSTQNTVGATNSYDPATKTFTLNYFYNTGAPRTIHETLKFIHP